jgi:hypothetical protein
MVREILDRILGTGDASHATRGWRCPDEASLAAFVDAQTDENSRVRVLNHLIGCRFCRDQVAAAVRIQSGQVPSEILPGLLAQARSFAENKRSGRGSPTLRWGALAAAVASVALVLAVTYRQPESLTTLPKFRPAPPPISSAPTAIPSVATELPSVRNRQNATAAPDLLYPREGWAVSPTGIEFRWKPVPTALTYNVRVVTEDGDVVWEGESQDPQIKLPSSVQLASGESFYVRVGANLPEGKTVTAKVVSFVVKRPG